MVESTEVPALLPVDTLRFMKTGDGRLITTGAAAPAVLRSMEEEVVAARDARSLMVSTSGCVEA